MQHYPLLLDSAFGSLSVSSHQFLLIIVRCALNSTLATWQISTLSIKKHNKAKSCNFMQILDLRNTFENSPSQGWKPIFNEADLWALMSPKCVGLTNPSTTEEVRAAVAECGSSTCCWGSWDLESFSSVQPTRLTLLDKFIVEKHCYTKYWTKRKFPYFPADFIF